MVIVMKILGIHEGTNATACIMIDGEIKACASEERFVGKKNYSGYPKNAVKYCMEFCKLKPEDIDYVALATYEFGLNYIRINRDTEFTVQDYLDEQNYYWKPLLYEKKKTDFWEKLQKNPRFQRNDLPYDFEKLDRLINEGKDEQEVFLQIRKEAVERE